MVDQAEQLRQLMGGHSNPTAKKSVDPRVIVVASGKGGVGKSNFSVNFALALRMSNFKPIVIDADVGFGNVEVLLGVRPSHSLMDLLNGISVWDLVEYSTTGLPFISAGNGLAEMTNISEADMETMVSELKKLHEEFDIVIIDSGAGISSNMTPIFSAADDMILITTPEPTSMADAYALLKFLNKRGELPPTHLVVNRVKSLVDGKATADKLRLVADKFLNLPLKVLGYVLEDVNVVNAVMQQEALMAMYPKSPAARCVAQLVQNYLRTDSEAPKKGLTGFLEKMFRKRRSGG